MTVLDYADALKATYWDKKKGSLPAGEVPDKLKALQKKHDAVDWKLFDARWPQQAKSAAELDEAFAKRDRLYRSSVFAMKRDANELIAAVQRLGKDKASAKPTQDAAKAIATAATGYANAIDDGADELKKAHQKALAALPKPDDNAGDPDDGPDSALLDPKKLLQQLQACQRDPDRTVRFGFVDAKDKSPAALAVHPKVDGRKLFARLQQETGVKTGAYGSLWVDGSSLMLQLDKPLSGLVKKIRAPLKDCGFKVAKVVLWDEDGSVFEADEEEETASSIPPAPPLPPARPSGPPSSAPTAAPATAPAPPAGKAATPAATPAAPTDPMEAEFKRVKSRLYPSLVKAVKGDSDDKDTLLTLMGKAMKFEKTGDWAQALDIYDQIADLLDIDTAPAEDEGEADGEPDEAARASADSRPEALDEHGLARWRVARERAIATLMSSAKEIAARRDPGSAPTLLKIKAVANNLISAPSNTREVAELQRYVERDDVVLEVNGIGKDFRGALLDALALLR